jgi:3-dehydroquinate dehydratase/shikimate dehydrogenase
MGEAGKWTRILGLAHGTYLTYGSLEQGKETADGQISAKDLVEVYRVKELDQETKVFGIVGDPVSSSLSPYMQNPAFVAEKVNAVFIPLLVKDLGEFFRRMVRRDTREVELNFGGFSVTMPHKQAIMTHLDEIDPVAHKIGAVNTVKIGGDKLIGFNTDAHGFITPLKNRFGDLKGAKIAVGGAGGAARACLYSLAEEGADITVYARDQTKAAALAEEFGVKVGTPHTSFKPGTIDILVNATPLGMKGGETEGTIATAAQLNGVKLVYDLVYNPVETRLMREAKAAGVPSIGGLEMLVAQGARQFEIWTGRKAPVELMRNAVLERINDGS